MDTDATRDATRSYSKPFVVAMSLELLSGTTHEVVVLARTWIGPVTPAMILMRRDGSSTHIGPS